MVLRAGRASSGDPDGDSNGDSGKAAP